ncbi:metalloprotease [Diaporthe helianthi]|uniref:Metalloprotease n=1 Tax=Diaporthe helianthi TaxID=158607 RepID=A0A2P5HY40_DIAHE|nr:metalloprotease [Diaporthe helianthi]
MSLVVSRWTDFQKQEQVDDQLAVINNEFAPHNISFNLINVTRTINADWATSGLESYPFKKALRKGDWSTLNIYSVKSICSDGRSIGGYGTIPQISPQNSTNFHLDGCVISSNTMPVSNSTRKNMGFTAVHEIGHWLNLFHPFEGGCDGYGDFVDDTPAMLPDKGVGTCEEGQDTCPKHPGNDPIHNYSKFIP